MEGNREYPPVPPCDPEYVEIVLCINRHLVIVRWNHKHLMSNYVYNGFRSNIVTILVNTNWYSMAVEFINALNWAQRKYDLCLCVLTRQWFILFLGTVSSRRGKTKDRRNGCEDILFSRPLWEITTNAFSRYQLIPISLFKCLIGKNQYCLVPPEALCPLSDTSGICGGNLPLIIIVKYGAFGAWKPQREIQLRTYSTFKWYVKCTSTTKCKQRYVCSFEEITTT